MFSILKEERKKEKEGPKNRRIIKDHKTIIKKNIFFYCIADNYYHTKLHIFSIALPTDERTRWN